MKSIITTVAAVVLAHVTLAATTIHPAKPLAEIHLDITQPKAIKVAQPAPNWDRDVLAPLRNHQAEAAAAAKLKDCTDKGGHLENDNCVVPEPAPQPPVAAPVVVREAPAPSDHQGLMAAAGIAPSDYPAVEFIINSESGWDPTNYYGRSVGLAYNPASSAAGLPQALPYSKTGCAWGDAVCQLVWADGYAKARYGGWWPAKAHWLASRNW